MYEIDADRVLWKGKAIKGADASSFELLSDTLGVDRDAVYMPGKPVKAERGSFEI